MDGCIHRPLYVESETRGHEGNQALIREMCLEGKHAVLAVLFMVVAAAMTPLPASARNEEPVRGLLGLDRADSALANMVATERAFSALSVERGMREAYLHFMADDGVLFQPLAV